MTLRRIASTLLLAAAAALVWAVTPALSTQPCPRPRPTSSSPSRPRSSSARRPRGTLERAAAHGGYGAHGPVLYRSEPIAAPHRFDLVGIAGNLHAFEYRARVSGGEWGRWTETDNGDPVYTGGSDELQIRSRSRPIRGTLHYVDVERGSRVRPAPMPPPRGRRASPTSSPAASGAPSRSGAAASPAIGPDMGRIKAGVIHHTVSTNTYSEAEVPGIVLGICRFHRNGNGWDDIGYNALVDRFGNVYQGRAGGMSRPVIGAHAEGVNTQTTGVAAIGDFTRKKPSKELQRGIVKYLAWKLEHLRACPPRAAPS